MILSSIELEILANSCTLSTFIREKIGNSLYIAIYDPNKSFPSRFQILSNPQNYKNPDSEMLLLCAEYLQTNVSNFLLNINVI